MSTQGREDANRFWQWFEANHQAFFFLNEVDAEEKDRLMNALLHELHRYCEGLYYEIGGHPDDPEVELIVTADGNQELFHAVELLIDQAPTLPNWKFIKFRQAQGKGFVTEYGGLKFDPETILFLPLKHRQEPRKVGFNVCYPNFNEEQRNTFLGATYIMLDTLLGEKASVCDIDYFDVIQTPANIGDYHFRHLSDIAEYIREVKSTEDSL